MALVFNNNASNFVNCGTSATLNPVKMTVSAWVNVSSFASQEWVVARDDNVLGRAFAFGCEAGGGLQFQANGSSNTSSLTLSTGVNSHIACAGPGAAWVYYLNGASNVPGGSTAMGSATGSLTIGKRTFSGFNGPFSGNISQVAIWNVILSSVEIVSLSKGVSPLTIRPTSLIAFWPLRSPAGAQIDLSGRNNTGIVNGSLSFATDPPLLWSVAPTKTVKGQIAASSIVFRRSLSALGARAGSRQVHL